MRTGAGPGVIAAPDSVSAVREAAAARLRAAGVDSPEADARLIVAHALGLGRSDILTTAGRPVTADEAARIDSLVGRRERREPIAYILREKEFWSLPLHVSPATLIPRPETETVVESALALIDAGGGRQRALRIADLGTGTGALLVALLSELPNAFGVGVDISATALEMAQANATRHGFASRARFVLGNFAAPLRDFDFVVSNPPYVETGAIPALAPDVRGFEPLLALDGGADGLAAYRVIAGEAVLALRPGGILIVEIGQGQADDVTALFREAGFTSAGSPRADLAGIPRALAFLTAG